MSPPPQAARTRNSLPGSGPGAGAVELRAEAAYQLMPDLGAVFSGIDPALRESLNAWIAESILAA